MLPLELGAGADLAPPPPRQRRPPVPRRRPGREAHQADVRGGARVARVDPTLQPTLFTKVTSRRDDREAFVLCIRRSCVRSVYRARFKDDNIAWRAEDKRWNMKTTFHQISIQVAKKILGLIYGRTLRGLANHSAETRAVERSRS